MGNTRIIMATADDARRWLAINKDNRRTVMVRVNRLRDAMLRGEWRESTDAIGIYGRTGDAAARLLNGQHRALALILADEVQPGIAVPMLVVENLEIDSQLVLDVGKSRTLEDTLHFIGVTEVNPRLLAGSLSLAWHVMHGTEVSRTPTPTRRQEIDFYKGEASDLADVIPMANMVSRGAHIPLAGVGVALWLASRGANVDRLESWANDLAYGEGLTRKDMAYRLRERFAIWSANNNVDRGRPWKGRSNQCLCVERDVRRQADEPSASPIDRRPGRAMNDELISTTQAATLAGVSEMTIRRWVNAGRLPIARDRYVSNERERQTEPVRLYRPADVMAAKGNGVMSPADRGRMGGRGNKATSRVRSTQLPGLCEEDIMNPTKNMR